MRKSRDRSMKQEHETNTSQDDMHCSQSGPLEDLFVVLHVTRGLFSPNDFADATDCWSHCCMLTNVTCPIAKTNALVRHTMIHRGP